jgi:hypothetical protein
LQQVRQGNRRRKLVLRRFAAPVYKIVLGLDLRTKRYEYLAIIANKIGLFHRMAARLRTECLGQYNWYLIELPDGATGWPYKTDFK